MKRLSDKLILSLFVIILLAIADTFMMGFFRSKNTFQILAGTRVPVSGMLSEPVNETRVRLSLAPNKETGITDKKRLNTLMTYEPMSHFFFIDFAEVRGKMWRGVLEADAAAPAGDYTITVFEKGKLPPQDKKYHYLIRLFTNEKSYRKSFNSFTQRYFGFQPWWIILALFPVAVYSMFRAFRQAQREEATLQAKGIGPIYKLAKRKDTWEIIFGLGYNHGIRLGDRLIVMNREKQPVGRLIATKVESDFSHANLGMEEKIAPDYFIARTGQRERGEEDSEGAEPTP